MKALKHIALFALAFAPISFSHASFYLDSATGLFTPDNPAFNVCGFYTRTDTGPIFQVPASSVIFPDTVQNLELSFDRSFQDVQLIEVDPNQTPDCAPLTRSGAEQIGVSSVNVVYGCLDSQATNYNDLATVDDNSCYNASNSTTTITVPDYTMHFDFILFSLLGVLFFASLYAAANVAYKLLV